MTHHRHRHHHQQVEHRPLWHYFLFLLLILAVFVVGGWIALRNEYMELNKATRSEFVTPAPAPYTQILVNTPPAASIKAVTMVLDDSCYTMPKCVAFNRDYYREHRVVSEGTVIYELRENI